MTTCADGYRLMDGKCVTGAATCTAFVNGGINLIGADGVEYSNKSYLGYSGGGTWQYDTNLSDACTYKCAE